jgi:hypothetical protein
MMEVWSSPIPNGHKVHIAPVAGQGREFRAWGKGAGERCSRPRIWTAEAARGWRAPASEPSAGRARPGSSFSHCYTCTGQVTVLP